VSKSTVYLRHHHRGWFKHELALFDRAASRLWEGGFCVETDRGVTDEGDPWFVFCDAESGEVISHFASISGTYVVCAAILNGAQSGRSLANLIERFLQRRLGGRLDSVKSQSTPAA
jgi:hypothetical protein